MFIHAAVGDDGSFVLAGLTDGEWGDSFDDSSDFAAVKLDENGNELWRWQVITYGGNDPAWDVSLTFTLLATTKPSPDSISLSSHLCLAGWVSRSRSRPS